MLDSDLVNSVSLSMRPGKSALNVEADEGSIRPVGDIVTSRLLKNS
jgi:hypothetical protein